MTEVVLLSHVRSPYRACLQDRDAQTCKQAVPIGNDSAGEIRVEFASNRTSATWRTRKQRSSPAPCLEFRPICRWTAQRVRGDTTICFLAFTLRQILKRRVAGRSFDGSIIKLVEGLSVAGASGGVGQRERGSFRMRNEIPAVSMEAFLALRDRPTSGDQATQLWPFQTHCVVPRDLGNLPIGLQNDASRRWGSKSGPRQDHWPFTQPGPCRE